MVAHWDSSKQPENLNPKSLPDSTRPQPMDAPNGSLPPFLNKTYDMVDDRSTDPIVSWNNGGNGFVVWNSNEFQKELLPKFFKHNNFSSFVRQLNTYGFRKVDPDRWEFANEGFLKGQKQLLKGIQRRRPAPHGQQTMAAPQSQHSKPVCVEVGKFGIEGEIDRLKRDKNVLMAELVRLRQHQQQTDRELQMVLQRLHSTELRQQQMITFLGKAMQNTGFLAQLVQQNESNKRLATVRKKRRLPKQDNETENVVDEGPSSPVENQNQIVKYQPNTNDPVGMLMQYLNSPELSPKVDLPNLFRDLDHGKQDGFMMNAARMMGEISPSRVMKDLSEEMQIASPASPLSLMRFENVEGAGESTSSVAAAGENEDGGDPTAEQMADADFEWDQFFAQASSELDESGANQWWDENGGSLDNVDELTKQIQQLSS